MERYKQKPFDSMGNIFYGSTEKEEFTRFLGNRDTMFFVETIGISHPDPDYCITRNKCEYFVLEYVIKGKGYVCVNSVTHEVQADSVYILYPGSSHNYGTSKDDPYQKIWINFVSPTFMEIAKGIGIDSEVVFYNQVSCKPYFQQLVSIAENSYINENICLEVSRLIYNIFTELAEQKSQTRIKSSIAKQTQELLDQNIYEDKNIKDLAKELFVSATHLINEFEKEYRITPYQYYLAKKIQTAKYLLRNTNTPVKSISEQLHFADEHYFSNLFKQKVGMSPKAYRQLTLYESQ